VATCPWNREWQLPWTVQSCIMSEICGIFHVGANNGDNGGCVGSIVRITIVRSNRHPSKTSNPGLSPPPPLSPLHPHTNWPGAKRLRVRLGPPFSSPTLFFRFATVLVPRPIPPFHSTVSAPIMFKLSYIVCTPQRVQLPVWLEPASRRRPQ